MGSTTQKLNFIGCRPSLALVWQTYYRQGWQISKIQKLFDRIARKTSEDGLDHALQWCEKRGGLDKPFIL